MIAPAPPHVHAANASYTKAHSKRLATPLAPADPGLPIVVPELGYPSATVLRGSVDLQRNFCAFTVLSAERDRFPFANLYASADTDDTECERQAATFGAAGAPFLIAARCSLGLKDSSGAAKPAQGAVYRARGSVELPGAMTRSDFCGLIKS